MNQSFDKDMNFLQPRDAWDKLSMYEKAAMMKVAVDNGIYNLSDIRAKYNEFAEGGGLNSLPDTWTMEDEAGYRAWRNNLPDNLKYSNDNDYDMRRAYKAGVEPTLEADGYYHLGTRDPHTGRVLKAPHHPTYLIGINSDSRMGYYPTVDDKGVTYTDTWKGNTYAKGGSTKDDDLVDWIIREEGFNRKPEDIGDGKLTLGSGLTAKKWHDLYKKRGNKWSAADNRMAVKEEVANRRRWAERNIPNWDSLPESSQKALLSYKYNYDFNRENSPKLFKALADSNLPEVARQMDATSKDPKFRKGLSDRRKREQQWFMSDVAPISYTPNPLYEQTVSTSVYNPFTFQAENIQVLPVMVPDENSYVTAHEVSPSEQRRQQMQERFDAINRFNTLMNLISPQNNPVPAFMPTTGNSYLDAIGALGSHADGGSIHIAPSKKGTFTAAAKKHGKSVQAFASQVLAHPENYSPAMRKKANFARNAAKWHGLGGNLFGGETEGSQQMISKTATPEENVFSSFIVKASEDPMVIMARQNPEYKDVLAKIYDSQKYINGPELLTRDQASRLLEVYNYAGRPKMKPLQDGKTRAEISNPILGRSTMRLNITPREGLDDIIAELAHPIQNKYGNNKEWKEKLNFFYDTDDFRGKTNYDYPNRYESETHEDFQPLLEYYIFDNVLPGQRYVTYDDEGLLGNDSIIHNPSFIPQVTDSARVYNKRKQDVNYQYKIPRGKRKQRNKIISFFGDLF